LPNLLTEYTTDVGARLSTVHSRRSSLIDSRPLLSKGGTLWSQWPHPHASHCTVGGVDLLVRYDDRVGTRDEKL